ncbi:DUF6803 family protein [Azospirillum soli]|nr:DUF6803 family protein [Azospirillum soli]MBP2311792.1 hypothetical protein [Azospirillum soli]
MPPDSVDKDFSNYNAQGVFLIVAHVAMIFGMLDPTILSGAAAGGHSMH